jgi:hypothetical protein
MHERIVWLFRRYLADDASSTDSRKVKHTCPLEEGLRDACPSGLRAMHCPLGTSQTASASS